MDVSLWSLPSLCKIPYAVIPAKAGIQFEKTGFRLNPGLEDHLRGPETTKS
jgi:hypothetical protein